MPLPPEIPALTTVLGIGLLTGLERERRKARAPRQMVAGLRTFATVSLLGWSAFTLGGALLLAALALGLTLLLGVAYARSAPGDAGLTTEAALLLVLLLGALCTRSPALAAGLGVVLTGMLAWRDDLHRFARAGLTETEVRDGLILAGAALVILPLVPDKFIGSYDAINLRTVWLLCVLMMCIGALGHIAIRAAGARFGLPLAGFVSGFASSTATVASMGERARREPESLQAAVAAATLSSATTMLLMMLVLTAIDLRIALLLLPHLACAFVVACAYAARFALTPDRGRGEDLLRRHVFDWRLAVGAALMIGVVQLASALLFQWLGNPGVVLSTTLSGFADVHAAAASAAVLVPAGKITPDMVVLPVLTALSTNSISKGMMAIVMGGRAYAFRVVTGLLLILVALWLPWLLAQAPASASFATLIQVNSRTRLPVNASLQGHSACSGIPAAGVSHGERLVHRLLLVPA